MWGLTGAPLTLLLLLLEEEEEEEEEVEGCAKGPTPNLVKGHWVALRDGGTRPCCLSITGEAGSPRSVAVGKLGPPSKALLFTAMDDTPPPKTPLLPPPPAAAITATASAPGAAL